MTATNPVPHGTYSGYTHYKCRQECCLAAHREYNRKLRRLTAYGRWEPFVDAGPVRDHVLRLGDAGLGERSIADLAGVSHALIARLIRGDTVRGAAPTKRLRPATAERILSVTASLEVYSEYSQIDGTGTRRRLQALVAVGWTQQQLADRIGMRLTSLNRIVMGGGVNAGTARAVRGLYEELWDAVPLEASIAKRARTIAARNGWAPPLAWDDDTLDDPAAEPAGVGVEQRHSRQKLPDADEVAWLVDGGESVEQIAIRFAVTVEAVKGKLQSARKRVAA